jgi:parallel beta-helix repeat protein
MIVLFLVALGAAWVGLRRLGESPVEPRVPSPAPNGLASGPAAGAAPEQSPGEPASGERVGQEEPAGGAAAGRESAGQEPAGGEVIAQEGAGQEAARGKGTGQTQHGGPPAEPPVESRPAPVVPPAPKQAGEPAAGSEGTPAETRSPATTPPAPSEPAPGATPPVTTTTERTEPAVEAKPPSPPESKEAQTPPELPPPAPAIVPLTAVALQIPAHPTQSTVELAWTPSAATGFSRYEIHHSTSAGFSPSPATLYATDLRDRNQTHLEIRNLECGVTHYFKVRVEDTDGHFADSPEQSMATLPCPFPDQIVVSTRGDGAYTDLVKAIQAINENSEAKPGMKVVLREGTYTLQERIWIGKSIEIVGENAVVEASGAGAFVMQATEATIRGVTFRAASQSAINVPEGSLTLEDCNVRSVQGSAVDIYGPGSIEIHRSELAGSGGKGLLVRGKAQATLEDCHIDGNQSGIDVSDNGRATLHGCRIDTSTQSGVYVHGGGQVTLEGCSVTGNQYSGVSVQDNAVVRLDRCKLNGNAQYGLNVGAGANVTLADCDLTGNGYGPLYEEDGSRVSQQGDNRMK